MKLSVIVIIYNMRREAPRTLHSLSAAYQRNMDADDYEVIVLENGSPEPLDAATIAGLGKNFRYHYVENASPSPAPAMNLGLRMAKGDVIAMMIDGARICTPGLLDQGLQATALYPRTVVGTMGFYLGDCYQRDAILKGYDQRAEDQVLARIGWPEDGYRLFEVGCADESSRFFQPLSESNALFLRRELWTELGGVDERYDTPGGGLVNLDTFDRANELPGTELVVMLGEATFHQVHGGVATNSAIDVFEPRFHAWCAQYEQLRGKKWTLVPKPRRYFGTLPWQCLRHVAAEVNELIPPPFVAERRALEAQIADAHTVRQMVEARLVDAHVAFEGVRRELDILMASHSWLLTRPLRSAYRRVHSLRDRLSRLTHRGNGA